MLLNLFLVTVLSSELPAFDHRKLWCLQTLCWLHGERSLPIGLLVYSSVQSLQPPPPVPTPLPEGWAVWDFAHTFELVELKDTLKQYKETETHFYKTLDRNMHTIDRIYRIQNPVLWSNFTK